MMHPKRLTGSAGGIARYYSVGDYYTKGDAETSQWRGEIARDLGLSGPVDAATFERLLAGEVVRDGAQLSPADETPPHGEPAPEQRDDRAEAGASAERGQGDRSDEPDAPGSTEPPEHSASPFDNGPNGPEVDIETLAAAFQSDATEANQQLGRRKPDGTIEHHPGWDFGLNAPKSVSMMALIAGDERLVEAHEKAVRDALAYVEEHASTRLRIEGEIEHRETGRLLIASFTEHGSRELDPHLHTHNVVLNMTNFEDGERMRSLETRAMYAVQRGAGQIYRNTLAHHVIEAGYEIATDPRSGLFEIAHIPEAAIEKFSQRHEQIEAYAKEHGLEGQAERRAAWAMTRQPKQHMAPGDMAAEWRGRDSLTTELLDTLHADSHAHAREIERNPATALEAVRFGIAQSETKEAVNNRDRLIRTGLAAHVGETVWQEMRPILRDREESGKLASAHTQTGNDLLIRGRTTARSIRQEEKISEELALADRIMTPLSTAGRAASAATERGLNPDQARAVNMIATSENRVMGVIGVAGAGKSTLARAVIEASDPDHRFISLGTTSSAAFGLGSKTSKEDVTLASLLASRGRVNGSMIDHNTTIFLDESSMASTRQTIRMLEITRQTGTRVVMLGDTKQLGAIEKGKPFWLLHRLGMETTLLGKSERAATRNMREMAILARRGAYAESFQYMDKITEDDDYQKLAKQAVTDYIHLSPRHRRATALLTLDNGTKTLVNGMVREELKREGAFRGEEVSFEVLVPENMSAEEKRNARFYRPGQVVVLAADNRQAGLAKDTEYRVVGKTTGEDGKLRVRLEDANGNRSDWQPRSSSSTTIGVFRPETRDLAGGDRIQWRLKSSDGKIRNAERGTVTAVSDTNVRIRWDDRNRTSILNLTETRNKIWDHGYAETVYQAQGKDYDRPFGIIDRTSPLTTGQTFYTFLTRGRFGARLYTQDAEKLARRLADNSGDKSSALEGLDQLKPNRVDERLKRDESKIRRQQQEERAAIEERGRAEAQRLSERRGQSGPKTGLRATIEKLAREIERANRLQEKGGRDGPVVRFSLDTYDRIASGIEKMREGRPQQRPQERSNSRGHER